MDNNIIDKLIVNPNSTENYFEFGYYKSDEDNFDFRVSSDKKEAIITGNKIIKAISNYDSLLEALEELVNDHEKHFAISFIDDAIISRAKEAIQKLQNNKN